jgi:hypothetical protein
VTALLALVLVCTLQCVLTHCFGTLLLIIVYLDLIHNLGACGGVVVKALRYKPAGSGFDSR